MVLFYFSDTKPHNTAHDEKITLKKVLDLVNKSDEQGLREMNKKLQNMLEETLTKNMHLQKVRFCILWHIIGFCSPPSKVYCNHMKSLNKTETPIFILLGVLCFQG